MRFHLFRLFRFVRIEVKYAKSYPIAFISFTLDYFDLSHLFRGYFALPSFAFRLFRLYRVLRRTRSCDSLDFLMQVRDNAARR